MVRRDYRGFPPQPIARFPIRQDQFITDALPPEVVAILRGVREAGLAPYRGVTTSGEVEPGLYLLDGVDEVDVPTMVQAANDYLAALSPSERHVGSLPLSAPELRVWTNAYTAWEPHGLLLDDLSHTQRDAALGVLRASLSPRGYEQVRTVMRFNQILGELVDDYHDSLKEFVYRFTIFGTPDPVQPWGWQLSGHHLSAHCMLVGGQLVLTPTFMGAEPSYADDGPWRGTQIFVEEARSGLAMMNILDEEQRATATLFPSMHAADLPPELNHPTEGRMRAGAGADNLTLGYQGLSAADMNAEQRDALLDVIGNYTDVNPTGAAGRRLDAVVRHLDNTHLSWVGQSGPSDSFFYRIHSPVVLIEFDHHAGVFLSNEDPMPFHAHTVVRTPNGNDYGLDLLRQHRLAHDHDHPH